MTATSGCDLWITSSTSSPVLGLFGPVESKDLNEAWIEFRFFLAEALAENVLRQLEHSVVFGLLVDEVQQGAQRIGVVMDVSGRRLTSLPDDELLDEGEQVGVAVAPDLIQRPALLLPQPFGELHAAEPTRQKMTVKVKLQVAELDLEIPRGLLRRDPAAVKAIQR
jgi:ABC-type ATPase involved in cell division